MSQLSPGFYSLWLPRVTNFVTAAIFTIFHILTFENKTRDLQPIQGLCRVVALGFTAFSVACNHWVFFFTNLYKLFFTMESWTCNFLAWVGTVLAPSRGVPARHGRLCDNSFPLCLSWVARRRSHKHPKPQAKIVLLRKPAETLVVATNAKRLGYTAVSEE